MVSGVASPNLWKKNNSFTMQLDLPAHLMLCVRGSCNSHLRHNSAVLEQLCAACSTRWSFQRLTCTAALIKSPVCLIYDCFPFKKVIVRIVISYTPKKDAEKKKPTEATVLFIATVNSVAGCRLL